MGVPKFNSNAEKAKYYKELKRKKNSEINSKKYQNNLKKNEKTVINDSQSKAAILKRNQRLKIKEKINKRVKATTYKRDYRLNQKQKLNLDKDTCTFINRMEKCRSLHKIKKALPVNPSKRETVMKAYIDKSPAMKCLKRTIETNSENKATENAIEHLKTFISESKLKRSNESRMAMNIVSASLSGEEINHDSAKDRAIAIKLGLKPRRLFGGKRIRTQILKSEKSCFEITKRKTRSDAVTEDTKRIVFDFWCSPSISRTSSNKKDIKRMRIAPNTFSSHQIHLLEKTQTEAYLEFKCKHPEINISQRLFENYKPFFVKPVRPKDRCTCCCRQHVEIRSVFKQCMLYRKSVLKNKTNQEKETYQVFEHISDVTSLTLCPKKEGEDFHEIKCLNRECDKCGINKIEYLPEELDQSDNSPDIKWERYEYKNIAGKGGKMCRKLQYVTKNTKPGIMFNYFSKLLTDFPAHEHRANWQNGQFKNNLDNLPDDHAICVHDYSENYRCSDHREIQSSYFQKTEVSIHVTILYRHAILEVDGDDSSSLNPNIISEQFFVISPDLQHDRNFTRYCQKQISDYLKSISANIACMHEWTDGCSSQYKSRLCMGDTSHSDLGYKTLKRNYHETSHAKGPQDAAGGFLKHQADFAVLRRKAKIQDAKDFYDFCEANLQNPKAGIYKRRIFKYVETVPRSDCINYKPITENRKIHQITYQETSPGELKTSHLSCYSCETCIEGTDQICSNRHFIGNFKTLIIKEITPNTNDQSDTPLEDEPEPENLSSFIENGSVIAVLADDSEYEFYIMKVNKKAFTLANESHDVWGGIFPAGAEVIQGLYYDRCKRNPLLYRLIPRKLAFVYSVAVRYICVELNPSKLITIPEQLHLDIIKSVSLNLV